jgi:hypothetical protein
VSWADLWQAHVAPTEPVAERELGPDEPQQPWESPEVYFARVGASKPAEPPARRSRAKGADDAAK